MITKFNNMLLSEGRRISLAAEWRSIQLITVEEGGNMKRDTPDVHIDDSEVKHYAYHWPRW
jgi:hypothetical protein